MLPQTGRPGGHDHHHHLVRRDVGPRFGGARRAATVIATSGRTDSSASLRRPPLRVGASEGEAGGLQVKGDDKPATGAGAD
jgi:hypothetical protein